MLHCTAFGISPTLKYVDLTVITKTEYAVIYGSIISDNKICCATPGGQITCYVIFSFRYSSENDFLLSTTQNFLPTTRPPVQ